MTTVIDKASAKKRLIIRLLPFIGLYFALFFFHLFMPNNIADDRYFCTVLQSSSLWAHTVKFFETWSARTLIEGAAILIGGLPALVWKILNPAAITLCAYAISRLFFSSNRGAVISCLLIFAYSWQSMSAAGWVISTMVYIWPMAAFLCAVMLCAKAQLTHKSNVLQFILCAVLCVYAFNMEQLNAFAIVLIIAVYAVLLYTRQRLNGILYIPPIASLANLAYAFMCPGTAARMQNEIITRNKTFELLNVFQKIEQGFSVTMREALFNIEAAVIILAVILTLIIFNTYKGLLYKLTAAGFLACAVILGPVSSVFGELSIFNSIRNAAFVDILNAYSIKAYLPLLLFCFVFALFLLCIYAALGHNVKAFIAMVLFVASIAARCALGISPTLIASGSRTAAILLFGLTALCVMLFKKLCSTCPKWCEYTVFALCGLFAARQAIVLAFLLF